MFASYPKILVAGLAAAGALGLSACGQKGNLYLTPEQQAEAARLAAPRPSPVTPAPAPAAAPASLPQSQP